ncbi:sensor histidine kinase [Shewanella litorisediminis]|uniref:histidine kinase n=1 Tax=Shewanella litorisediminis TaxID=1173586 RepID=A0ABX7G7B9_9GAMM|nr:HAMP domain-containing sensor histidine kinase [Shewanella litorisediminis]MCL2920143.1 HAMP domain-containing histidine kinase [Shewanella litorisediminis]QRH03257.1 HAMP domain-containing histidine kinase [Shewanella litorisediminis]
MSIKHYLFALFGGLILLLGLSQLLIGEALKQQLDEDLRKDSLALSRQLVDIVVEDLGDNLQFVQQVQIKRENGELPKQDSASLSEHDKALLESLKVKVPSQSEIIELQQLEVGRALAEVEAKLEQRAELESENDSELHRQQDAYIREALSRELENLSRMQELLTREYQQALHQSLDTLTINTRETAEGGRVMVVRTGSGVQMESRHLEFGQNNVSEALSRFREWMAALILVSSLLALIFVYWLSRRVSGPLSELATGHRKLGEGQLGYQVTPRGVDEIKTMLEGFNAMSEKLAQLSAREQQIASQQHLVELGEITRGIAHSLRNPLHTLGLLAENQSQTDDASLRALQLGQIQQKIAMMDKHIQSLLTLSSSEVDRSRPIPVNAVVQDILLELSVAGVKPQLSLSGFETEHWLPGMESEIRSILHAVIINAVEAQAGNDAPWLGIDVSAGQGQLCVTVTDKGVGMDEHLIERLGQPHVTTKPEGTGMGLYIASRLLTSHYGGSLTFTRPKDGGTRVVVHFKQQED